MTEPAPDIHRVYHGLRDHPPGQPGGWYGQALAHLYVGAQPYVCRVEGCVTCRRNPEHRLDSLVALGVTHVMSVADDAPVHEGMVTFRDLLWHNDPVADRGSVPPDAWFDDGVRYAAAVLANGGTLYVHCFIGSARGPSMAYAILRQQGLSEQGARKRIREARPNADLYYVPDAEWWYTQRFGRRRT